MSQVDKRPLAQVMPIAEQIQDRIAPYFDRIEVAGSLRRKRPEVGDIEFVCVPKLYGLIPGPNSEQEINFFLRDSPTINIVSGAKAGSKKTVFEFTTGRGLLYKVELWLQPDPATWGVNMMIRTGSEEFSKRMVKAQMYGGLKPDDIEFKDGRIKRVGEFGEEWLDTPEEQCLFDLWGMEYPKPEDRK